MSRRLILSVTALAVVLGLIALCWLNPPLLRQVELKIYDQFLARTASGQPLGVTAVVDVDEAALREYGQWPWPRYQLARLVQLLLDAGARVVALDILLTEEDRTSVRSVLQGMRRDLGIEARLTGLPDGLDDNDLLLASILDGAPVALGSFLLMDAGTADTAAGNSTLPPSVGLAAVDATADAAPPEDALLRARGMLAPIPKLAAVPTGFVNAPMDQDGLVRRMPLLARVGSRTYANLSLRALMLYLGKGNLKLIRSEDGQLRVQVGKVSMPVSAEGYLLLPYLGPGRTFPYISAGEVLAGRLDPAAVRDKIIFIGSSAAGAMDIRATPLDQYMPGVEAHATMVNAALSGSTLDVPVWAPSLNMALIVLAGLVSLPLFGVAPPLISLAGSMALMGAAYWGSWTFFARGIWISPLWALLAVGVQGVLLTAARYFLSEKDKRRIRHIFGRYVSPEVVARIVDRGEEALRGEQRELTVMFTDLRGFTSISEKLTPVQVVSLLNRYFTPMTEIVRSSGGTLDKYIGDALMAFWNAPLAVADHPARAVNAALRMQSALQELNVTLEQDFGLRLRMGAGIHSGPAHVGNMGSDDLTSYTALGDTVNLASRLEGLCSRYGVTLVVSGETAARCGGGLVLRELARLRVKGRAEPVDVFTVLRPEEAEEQKELLACWTEALRLYREAVREKDVRRLAQAGQAFAHLQAVWPGPLHQAYVDACSQLREGGGTWTEVWTLTGK